MGITRPALVLPEGIDVVLPSASPELPPAERL